MKYPGRPGRAELAREGHEIALECRQAKRLVDPTNSKRMEIKKKAIRAPDALNEAFQYLRPSSFSRGLRLDFGSISALLISGTASIGPDGETLHVGDFRGQTRRTFYNITRLLAAEGATWKDVVRTTCYLRDIDQDYAAFNEERTAFYQEQGLDPLPASTGIQAKLCRPELLIEIEAIAVFCSESKP